MFSERASDSTDTATLRSNRQKRWERLNRSLEDDLNRISVVAEDADEEGNGELKRILHACPRGKENYSTRGTLWLMKIEIGRVQVDPSGS